MQKATRAAGKTASVFLAVCALAPLAGCAKKAAGNADGREHVKYYLWEDPGYRAIVDAFNASQDDIFVDAQYMPNADYEVKITTLLTGRTEMDAYM